MPIRNAAIRSSPLPTPRCRQSAFTLLELTLVLAIIVLIGAIIAPQLAETFERQKLQGAAESLRMLYEKTRLEAMRTGQAQVFECLPGSRDYAVRPLLQSADAANAGAGATLMTGAGALVETDSEGLLQSATPLNSDAQQLDERISFLSCIVSGDMRTYTLRQSSASLSPQATAQNIIFYPDGSTSTAEVRIQNERGDVRAIQLRGLTGHSRIIDVANVPSSSES